MLHNRFRVRQVVGGGDDRRHTTLVDRVEVRMGEEQGDGAALERVVLGADQIPSRRNVQNGLELFLGDLDGSLVAFPRRLWQGCAEVEFLARLPRGAFRLGTALALVAVAPLGMHDHAVPGGIGAAGAAPVAEGVVLAVATRGYAGGAHWRVTVGDPPVVAPARAPRTGRGTRVPPSTLDPLRP